ncbi:MAG: sugar ABC transporter permease [Anaerolineae bacterium]|nr:sugar ABC transporter permease [Anaerolineae bacterium]
MATVRSAQTAEAASVRASTPHKQRKPWFSILLFIGPALALYTLFLLVPVLTTFYNSLYRIEPIGGELTATFVGLDNYVEALTKDKWFGQYAVPNTIIWALVGPVLEMTVATLLALILYFKTPFHRLFRAVWFTPILISGVVVGWLFRWVFNPDWGPLTLFVEGLGLEPLNWLVDVPLASVIVVHFWRTFGFSMVILLAGLSSISDELVEAARIDGAGTWKVILYILLPLLRGTFVNVLILSFIGKMSAFDTVFVLTDGGPMHRSETVATWVYTRTWNWRGLDLGYPSAMAVIWFLVIFIVTLLLQRYLQRRETLEF